MSNYGKFCLAVTKYSIPGKRARRSASVAHQSSKHYDLSFDKGKKLKKRSKIFKVVFCKKLPPNDNLIRISWSQIHRKNLVRFGENPRRLSRNAAALDRHTDRQEFASSVEYKRTFAPLWSKTTKKAQHPCITREMKFIVHNKDRHT